MDRSAKYLKSLVGASGFEPETSCAQGRRATRLRYAPTCVSYYSSVLCKFASIALANRPVKKLVDSSLPYLELQPVPRDSDPGMTRYMSSSSFTLSLGSEREYLTRTLNNSCPPAALYNIGNAMVYKQKKVTSVFAALADPTRRRILRLDQMGGSRVKRSRSALMSSPRNSRNA
jgi:hypothetical protein